MQELVGRSGLARILEVTDNTARAVEHRGEISAVAIVDGRPLFSAAEARALRSAWIARKSAQQAARA